MPLALPFAHGSFDDFCTVSLLLEALPHLGLPHFQRGQVWDDASRSRLLESLSTGTPCGSVILWRPAHDVAQQGEAVPVWRTGKMQWLVVDGQQRLTALAEVLDPENRWGLNLAAAPELWPEGRTRPPRLQRLARFIRKHGRLADSDSIVLLSDLEKNGADAWPFPDHPRPPAWEATVQAINGIRDRRLQVVVRDGDDLPGIVSMYIRINESGVAVRSDERAYAALIDHHPEGSAWLGRMFAAVHPDRTANRRTDLLKRQRERMFGFSMFVRVMIQAVSHHMDGDRTDLDSTGSWQWQSRWLEDPELRARVFETGEAAAIRVARVLRERLGCDDYRFLPSADGLRPVFALLLKYPQVGDAIVARAILALQLGTSPTRGRLRDDKVAARIRSSDTLAEALDALPALGPLESLQTRLHQARGTQDRWVSLFYWYQCTHGARDWGGDERVLNRHAAAHKEHIVPFSALVPLYDDLASRGGRSRRHAANSLGNLTFLSAGFNLDKMAEMVEPANASPGILGPHFLDAPEVREAMGLVRQNLQTDHGAAREAFEAFVRARTDHMASALHTWISDILAVTPANPGLRPTPQLVHASTADTIRGRDWPEDLKDVMLRLYRTRVASQRGVWVLDRHTGGPDKGRWVENQLRLTHDASVLYIGKGLPLADALRTALASDLRFTDHGSQWSATLEPHRAAASLEIVRGFLSAAAVPGPAPAPPSSDGRG